MMFISPLIGANLAKQLGTVGNDKRTDRMGMLLLVSPPGYGKTTLMEYMADRMGLVFMKINGLVNRSRYCFN
ncbi:AAA family ATPase [Chryseobacterium indoltheticum]|uniref:AAA family ATPase n=1 Tax=Chryseobacterium indoltheticum TaxID=254 RepID=UPI003F49187C